MNTLTLITEGNRINHHYAIKSAAISPSTDWRFLIIMDEDEADNFLMDFIDGKTGYRLEIDTENVRIEVKHKCFSTAKVYAEQADEGILAFTINAEKIVS